MIWLQFTAGAAAVLVAGYFIVKFADDIARETGLGRVWVGVLIPDKWRIPPMSRPLFTGDPQDAQLEPGMRTSIALAYWDANETAEGWTVWLLNRGNQSRFDSATIQLVP